tara:strand:- start:337 stop:765 length:429 start_codon:yes stop_codon:yes gene_type:complete
MHAALEEAQIAASKGEVPVGAVVVVNGEIIAKRHNQRESDHDPTAHAEILALQDAAKVIGDWRLTDATLFVTLEPCPMCAGAAWASRIGKVVYGAPSMDAGALGSLLNVGADPRLNYEFPVVGGLLAEESADLLAKFFSRHR